MLVSYIKYSNQEKLRKITEKIGKLPLFVDMKSGMFSKNALQEFDITSIVRLYKYSYLPYNDNVIEGMYKISLRKAIDFEKLFQPDNLSNFLILYKNILGNNSNQIDIVQFNKIAKIYLQNERIFEVATCPVKNSVNGYITYNTKTKYNDIIFENIRFDFVDGKIVKATAKENTKQLNDILDVDEGARYIGEFAFGLNPYINNTTLFDEKINGSFHFNSRNGIRRM